jgi:hypothetical protein
MAPLVRLDRPSLIQYSTPDPGTKSGTNEPGPGGGGEKNHRLHLKTGNAGPAGGYEERRATVQGERERKRECGMWTDILEMDDLLIWVVFP